MHTVKLYADQTERLLLAPNCDCNQGNVQNIQKAVLGVTDKLQETMLTMKFPEKNLEYRLTGMIFTI